MDNTPFSALVSEGLEALEIRLPEDAQSKLVWFCDELLRWNAKVNLTAITEPREVVEKHLLDSLAVLPELVGAGSLLDLGSGAGLPGIPVKLALPGIQVVMVDSVGKKISFVKHCVGQLGLVGGAKAVNVRAAGDPSGEGLGLSDRVISRALADVAAWLPLGSQYLAPHGRLLSMLGQSSGRAALEADAQASGLVLSSFREYALPWSGARRAVAAFERAASSPARS